jgi:phosphoribosylformylglycinamidine synthase
VQGPGDVVILLGEGRGELGGTEYLKLAYDVVRGLPPALDLDAERALQALVVALADGRLIQSAHDCADGGIAVTLAECCFDTGGLGIEASIDEVKVGRDAALNRAAALFGESASRVVVSVAPDRVDDVLSRAAASGVPARIIGRTGGTALRVKVDGRTAIDVSVEEAERVWSTAIDKHLVKRVA